MTNTSVVSFVISKKPSKLNSLRQSGHNAFCKTAYGSTASVIMGNLFLISLLIEQMLNQKGMIISVSGMQEDLASFELFGGEYPYQT